MPSTELDRPREIGSHDSVFSHGWEYGYVQAKIEDRIDFELSVLVSHLEIVLELLKVAGAKTWTSKPECNGFSVAFIPLRVEFPRGKELL